MIPLLLFAASLGLCSGSYLRVADSDLYPPGGRASTRSAHRRMIASWGGVARPSEPSYPVVFPTDYGADPTGTEDSSPAFAQALAAVLSRRSPGKNLSDGIADLGGCVLDLQGGAYLLSAPLHIPQFVGNMRIIDGTLRASPAFPAAEYLLQVGASPCSTPSGQGSCNQNIGLSGLTLDGSHAAAGCLLISSTMGATLDSSSAIFGFNQTGIHIQGGHEVMVSETWVAAYPWSSPFKETTDTVGILVAGNDHFLTSVIVYSARVGVKLTGAANKLVDVHTWNEATGNGGTGILNMASQNIFYGCYLDFTNLVLAVAQQLSFSGGFFLGGAQAVFAARSPSDAVVGVTLSGNVWYDCSGPSLAVNESSGAFTSVTDLQLTGTAFCGGSSSKATGLPQATQRLTAAAGGALPPKTYTVDFAPQLLFPHAGLVSASAAVSVLAGSAATGCQAAIVLPSVPAPGQPLTVQVSVTGGQCAAVDVSVDQSSSSSWSVIKV
jgi:hypothetical protein